ncbi:MAG: CDP-alcohol phosphatidyltransferase family protein [Blastocatellia bacterium]
MSNELEQPQANPPRRGIRRGIYLIPSMFTIGNILCGFYAVINSVKGYQYQSLGDTGQATALFDNAARAIGFAVLLDGLDGRIARLTKATSEFGVELDSIADVLTFGIAPAVMAYTWGYGSTPGLERLAWGVSFFFLICGALRLARFNVMARAPRFSVPGNTPKLDKRYFVGLPIPMAAGLLAAIIHFIPQPISGYGSEEIRVYSWVLLVGMSSLAILMVSTLRYASFKDIGPKSNKPFIILPLLSLLIAGIWFYSQWVLLILVSTYVSHGPLMKIWGFLSRFRRPIAEPDENANSASIEV